MYPISHKLAVTIIGSILTGVGLACYSSFVLHIRPFDSEIVTIFWLIIAIVSLRFQLPNTLNSHANLRLPGLSVQAKELVQSYWHRNLIRLAVVPIMVVVGLLGIFTPLESRTHPTVEESLLGVVLVIALFINELGFALLAVLEYRQYGPYRKLTEE